MNPSLLTRRSFLGRSVLGASLAPTLPAFVARSFGALAADSGAKKPAPPGRILVVVQLAGGNDGLNTVVPFSNDAYQRNRPRLGLKPASVLKLSDTIGLHPALAGLRGLYDAGRLGIVQGIGYPNPNRSHFRSTEIWQTASDANRVESRGWIGRYFDHACPGGDPAVGVSVGREAPQAFASSHPLGVSLQDPARYRYSPGDDGAGEMNADRVYRAMNRPLDPEADSGATVDSLAGARPNVASPLDFIERTALDAQISSDRILSLTRAGGDSGAYPSSRLGNALQWVSRLIVGGLETQIYYVSQGGYDTHTGQQGAHDRLLRDLDGSVAAFLKDLDQHGQLDRVLLMSFSEFGRRLAENASGGTDHGAASCQFVAGGRIQPGLLGTYPSLAPSDLHNGDLKASLDFRSLYAGVLQHWLRTDPAPILGRSFPPLSFLG